MNSISYQELQNRLTSEARDMFREMVTAHLDAGSGERKFFRVDSLAGTGMIFEPTTSQDLGTTSMGEPWKTSRYTDFCTSHIRAAETRPIA